ncbi:twin-arginine translocation signal domain-containing protein, partial [Vibrio sp. Vb2865]
MKCSRRNFLASSGALILTIGVAGTSVVSASLYA